MKIMHAWAKPTEETGYNLRKTAMVANPSLMVEVKDTWSKPIQESMYEQSKATMLVIHLPSVVPMGNGSSFPIQEIDYDQTKSVMVLASPAVCVPTYMYMYMKTPSRPSTL